MLIYLWQCRYQIIGSIQIGTHWFHSAALCWNDTTINKWNWNRMTILITYHWYSPCCHPCCRENRAYVVLNSCSMIDWDRCHRTLDVYGQWRPTKMDPFASQSSVDFDVQQNPIFVEKIKNTNNYYCSLLIIINPELIFISPFHVKYHSNEQKLMVLVSILNCCTTKVCSQFCSF